MLCDYSTSDVCPTCKRRGVIGAWRICRAKPEIKQEKKQSKGLGDMVADLTKAVGIQPCGGCKKRQEWLNKIGRPLTG